MYSYYALINLFGEFPLVTQHSNWGKVVGTITVVIAVAVFALPVGLIGNSLEGMLEKKKDAAEDETEAEGEVDPSTIRADPITQRGETVQLPSAPSGVVRCSL